MTAKLERCDCAPGGREEVGWLEVESWEGVRARSMDVDFDNRRKADLEGQLVSKIKEGTRR